MDEGIVFHHGDNAAIEGPDCALIARGFWLHRSSDQIYMDAAILARRHRRIECGTRKLSDKGLALLREIFGQPDFQFDYVRPCAPLHIHLICIQLPKKAMIHKIIDFSRAIRRDPPPQKRTAKIKKTVEPSF